jgi:hypothetical protein
MPKPIYVISSFLKKGLRWKIENHLGYKICTKQDCRKLSDLIKNKGLPTISESTLYRLFLLSDNSNSPFIHTLDILSKFIGFVDWLSLEEHLVEIAKFRMTYGKFYDGNSEIKSLLTICIHKDELRPLFDFLEQFPTEIDATQKHLLGDEMFSSLCSNPNKNVNFFKNFSKIPIVREGLFELLADPTFTIPQYEIGIKYYLENISPRNSNRELQDFIFGNCLLFRHYFVSNNSSALKKVGDSLYIHFDFELKTLEQIHLFPAIRYLSYKLIFFHVQGLTNKIEPYLEWLTEYAINSVKDKIIEEQKIIIHTLCDALQFDKYLQERVLTQLKSSLPEVFKFLPDYVDMINVNDAIKFLDTNAATVWRGFRL